VIGSELDRRYASALLEVASTGGVADRIGEEVSVIAQLFSSHRELKEALMNPVFSKDNREALIKALSRRLDLHQTTTNFLKTLLKKDRINELPGISQTYSMLADAKAGRVRATVLSAKELDDSVVQSVVDSLEKLSRKKVQIEKEVDRNLLGGLVVKIGDLVFDGSLRSQLDRFRQVLSRE